MTYTDYSEILHSFGCHPQLIRPRNFDGTIRKPWTEDRESFYDLYAYMESGFPILTSFNGHVVSLIGHTLQTTPRADHNVSGSLPILNSAAYLDSYIVVDDNFFPYQLLRYNGERQYHKNGYTSMVNQPTIDNIYTAVVPLPEKVFLSPRDCRSKTFRLLEQPDLQRIIADTRTASSDTTGPVVARQFVTAGASFKARKRAAFLKNPTDQLTRFPLTVNLPHFVWVIELLTEGLAGQGRAFGEVVMDATQGEADWEPIYVRIGDNLIAGNKQLNNTGVELSFNQFIHNLGGSV